VEVLVFGLFVFLLKAVDITTGFHHWLNLFGKDVLSEKLTKSGSRKMGHHGLKQEARLLCSCVRCLSVDSKVTVIMEIICLLSSARNSKPSFQQNQKFQQT
jgi:hypothetical protein